MSFAPHPTTSLPADQKSIDFMQFSSRKFGKFVCCRSQRILTGADPGFGQGVPQTLRPKVAEQSYMSEGSYLWLGSRASLRALEVSGFNAQICIIPHSRDSLSLIFVIYFNTKTDKNRMLDCTSNNLRYSYLLHLVAKLCETKTKNKDF